MRCATANWEWWQECGQTSYCSAISENSNIQLDYFRINYLFCLVARKITLKIVILWSLFLYAIRVYAIWYCCSFVCPDAFRCVLKTENKLDFVYCFTRLMWLVRAQRMMFAFFSPFSESFQSRVPRYIIIITLYVLCSCLHWYSRMFQQLYSEKANE